MDLELFGKTACGVHTIAAAHRACLVDCAFLQMRHGSMFAG